MCWLSLRWKNKDCKSTFNNNIQQWVCRLVFVSNPRCKLRWYFGRKPSNHNRSSYFLCNVKCWSGISHRYRDSNCTQESKNNSLTWRNYRQRERLILFERMEFVIRRIVFLGFFHQQHRLKPTKFLDPSTRVDSPLELWYQFCSHGWQSISSDNWISN